MADYSLVPVDYQPDFGSYSLVPVDYNPFSADGASQPAQGQHEGQHQPPLNGGDQSIAGAPANDAQSASGVPASGQPDNLSLPPRPPPGQPVPANQQQLGDISGRGPAGGVSGLIGALASDFYNQSILQPARNLRDMGHDLVTDPAYFWHAIQPSLVGLGMGAPMAQVGRLELAERAKEIHNLLDLVAQKLRTTAVLDTDAGRIIAGGTRDLDPLQRVVLGRGEIAAKAPRVHAEITALDKAASIGATPSVLAVTRTICPKCAAVIESLGGKLTSPTTAAFPRR